MTYSSWRITYQSAEQAAQAACPKVVELAEDAARLRYKNAQLEASVAHWKKNHAAMVDRCAYLSQRRDLPADRIPAYHAHEARIRSLEAHNAYLEALLADRAREVA